MGRQCRCGAGRLASEFVPHQTGLDGHDGRSYLDVVILRDRDGNNANWTAASDGTLGERIYHYQNCRADVSGIVEDTGEDTGEMAEWVKYSAYGVPFGLPRGGHGFGRRLRSGRSGQYRRMGVGIWC